MSGGKEHLQREQRVDLSGIDRQAEKEVGRQSLGMDRPGVHKVPEGSGEQRKMEETGREVISGDQTTPRLRYRWRNSLQYLHNPSPLPQPPGLITTSFQAQFSSR